ncbi:hypothetical protein E8E14_000292 [Neopestalotiopsis sp. 37M]|nr:hypothetical protein E8E14_000292 [Neopestalotiopsis sp. 37M]
MFSALSSKRGPCQSRHGPPAKRRTRNGIDSQGNLAGFVVADGDSDSGEELSSSEEESEEDSEEESEEELSDLYSESEDDDDNDGDNDKEDDAEGGDSNEGGEDNCGDNGNKDSDIDIGGGSLLWLFATP